MRRLICLSALILSIAQIARADKTLVSWVSLSSLDHRGGGCLSVETDDRRFDGIVFGELRPATWMAGSDHYRRTMKDQSSWAAESTTDKVLRMAIVYRGNRVTLYRDDAVLADYETKGQPLDLPDCTLAVFGRRESNADASGGTFIGRVYDARVYDSALKANDLSALRQNAEGPIRPWAWWLFGKSGAAERTGRFLAGTCSGGACIRDGALVLPGRGAAFLAASRANPFEWNGREANGPVCTVARRLRERIMADEDRPLYHFACIDGKAFPGDPNGAFFAKGRYHLMYLYQDPASGWGRNAISGFRWGHISSSDLLHWRHHPDAIVPEHGDSGAFSGGAFVDDDGTAYLSYWMLWGARGLGIVRSKDPNYLCWERHPANPVIKADKWGRAAVKLPDGSTRHVSNADPSNIWKKDGLYYMLAGNKMVLDAFGRGANAPQDYRGDWLDLYESADLANWKYIKKFYQRRADATRADGWTDEDEDNMCPTFLPLPSSPEGGSPSGKYLLSFISHNRGCQYYIGSYDRANNLFLPESHGRMTWQDKSYFAPEAMIDGKGRQLLWTWLHFDPPNSEAFGWCGVYALPRVLWLAKDGTLGIAPPPELEKLRLNCICRDKSFLSAGQRLELTGISGESAEIELEVPAEAAARLRLKVRCGKDASGGAEIRYDASARELVFDASAVPLRGGAEAIERAPFALRAAEPLKLRVFVDRSVVEVFANDRQAICRRIYPRGDDTRRLYLSAAEGEVPFAKLRAWEIDATNPY